MQIHELPDVTAIGSGGYFATDNGSQTTKIDYDALAKAIIEQYSASTLAGSAQSVKAALDGLMQKSLPTEIAPRTTIASGDDLNAYISPGIYRCATASIAASLSNCPISNVGFNLDVVQLYNTAFAYQRITASTGTTSSAVVEVYERFINVRDSMYGTWKKVPTRAEVDALSAKFGGMQMYMDNSNALSYMFTLANKDNSRHSAGLFFGGTANGREFCYLLWINATSNLVTITKLYDGLSARVFEATYDASTKVLTIQRTDATASGDRIFGGIRLIIG